MATTTVNNPLWDLQAQYLPGTFQAAGELYNTGQLSPEYYPGQTVADFDPVRAQGINQQIGVSPEQAALASQQSALVGGILGGTDPYTQQLAGQASAAAQQPFGAAGTFGSARAAQAGANAASQAIADRQLQAAGLVGDAQQNLLTSGQTTEAAGKQLQAYNQALLDADKARYDYNVGLPAQSLKNYQELLGFPGATTPSQTTSNQASGFEKALGIGSILGGATLGGGGSLLGKVFGFKEGGEVSGGMLGKPTSVKDKLQALAEGGEATSEVKPITVPNYGNVRWDMSGAVPQLVANPVRAPLIGMDTQRAISAVGGFTPAPVGFNPNSGKTELLPSFVSATDNDGEGRGRNADWEREQAIANDLYSSFGIDAPEFDLRKGVVGGAVDYAKQQADAREAYNQKAIEEGLPLYDTPFHERVFGYENPETPTFEWDGQTYDSYGNTATIQDIAKAQAELAAQGVNVNTNWGKNVGILEDETDYLPGSGKWDQPATGFDLGDVDTSVADSIAAGQPANSPVSTGQYISNKMAADKTAQEETGNPNASAVTNSSGEAVKTSSGKTVTSGTQKDDSNSSDDKIVCTAMNNDYGFGGFRQAIWLKYSQEHYSDKPEYQTGYHAIFLPLLEMRNKNWFGKEVVYPVLKHIARHRTADLRAELQGSKRDTIGRAWRFVLEPLCYGVGKVLNALQK